MANILLIDDDEAVRRVMKVTLERDGHEVVEASDGNEGLKKLRLQKPELLITDIVMPEKEGIETIREVRAAYPDLPIIAVSGGGTFGTSSYLDVSLLLGAKATLAKPFKVDELCGLVRDVLHDAGSALE